METAAKTWLASQELHEPPHQQLSVEHWAGLWLSRGLSVSQTGSTQMKAQQSFSITSQPFQLERTEPLLLLRTIFFPNFLFAFLLLFLGWKSLCHIRYMHLKELKTTFWQRVSSVFHGFNSASELRVTGIRVLGHLPFVINFSVSNVIIPFVSILVNCYVTNPFSTIYLAEVPKIKFYIKVRWQQAGQKGSTFFLFSVLWVLHISGWWK